MEIAHSVVLVTGANRGMGRVFVQELLKRGAAKIYVAARDMAALDEVVAGDPRLVALPLDVTNPQQIAAAAAIATDVTLLINNAGVSGFGGAISASGIDGARLEMEVNYFGPLALSRAFAPILANNGGAIVNILSMLALVTLPVAATYSASKAAALALTRSLRAELAAQGTQVVGVLAVQIDTDMGSSMPEPRMSPLEVVIDTLDAVQAGTNDEIAAGSETRKVHDFFKADPVGLQAHLATMIPSPHA